MNIIIIIMKAIGRTDIIDSVFHGSFKSPAIYHPLYKINAIKHKNNAIPTNMK